MTPSKPRKCTQCGGWETILRNSNLETCWKCSPLTYCIPCYWYGRYTPLIGGGGCLRCRDGDEKGMTMRQLVEKYGLKRSPINDNEHSEIIAWYSGCGK